MKQAKKSIYTALVCFLIVILLNFLLPRMLPGDPVAYLSGMDEEGLSAAQYAAFRSALHLDEPMLRQFGCYLRSLTDGTLGYSYQKEAAVAALIRQRLGNTMQITVPALILSTGLGLIWGLECGRKKSSALDRLSTGGLIVINAVPTFLTALVLMILFCFRLTRLPYTGLSSPDAVAGTPGFAADRLRHLILPVASLTLAVLPSRYLLMRNTAARAAEEKYVLYARQRGLSARRIKYCYILPNVAQPFLAMVGMSVSLCVGGSLVIENIFSVPGMGKLLNEAVYSLDYPLMQGILFVTTLISVCAVIVTDLICILIDPKQRLGGGV